MISECGHCGGHATTDALKSWGTPLMIGRTLLVCPNCGTSAQPQLVQRETQIAAKCQACGTWIRWVPTSQLWRALLSIQEAA